MSRLPDISHNPQHWFYSMIWLLGLDISPLGCDKSQILRDFKPIDLIYFFGDKLKEGENDYPLGHAIEQRRLGMVFEVTDYHHTWDLLK